jgi:hypothetical protein
VAVCLAVASSERVEWATDRYLGVCQIGVAYVFLTAAMRVLPALEVSLLLLIEPVLNPIWTWMIRSERPGTYTIIGGAIIICGDGDQERAYDARVQGSERDPSPQTQVPMIDLRRSTRARKVPTTKQCHQQERGHDRGESCCPRRSRLALAVRTGSGCDAPDESGARNEDLAPGDLRIAMEEPSTDHSRDDD